MSVNLTWRPLAKGVPFEDCNYTSSDHQALNNAFGDLPKTLTSSDIPKLEGMVAVAGDGSVYQAIIDKIYEVGEIIVSAEY